MHFGGFPQKKIFIINYLAYIYVDQWRMLAVPLQFSCSPVQMRTVVFYHVCHVIYHLCKDASSKFTGKSEIFSDFYFFPTHPYENLNALWHWELQSGTAVTSKMVWTLFSASPWQRTSCLLTQCKKPSTKDGIGGFGAASGQEGGTKYSVEGWGEWEWEAEEHVWCIQNTNGHEKLSSPSELRTHVKQANAKKPVVIYWKVTFTCVVPGW